MTFPFPQRSSTPPPARTPSQPVPQASSEPPYPEEYYEILARDLGEDRARWARLPYAERMRELEWYHATFDTPDDLSLWPAELDGGVERP
jgi:hypothetical protein